MSSNSIVASQSILGAVQNSNELSLIKITKWGLAPRIEQLGVPSYKANSKRQIEQSSYCSSNLDTTWADTPLAKILSINSLAWPLPGSEVTYLRLKTTVWLWLTDWLCESSAANPLAQKWLPSSSSALSESSEVWTAQLRYVSTSAASSRAVLCTERRTQIYKLICRKFFENNRFFETMTCTKFQSMTKNPKVSNILREKYVQLRQLFFSSILTSVYELEWPDETKRPRG